MEPPHFDREALIAEVAKRHKILLDPDDPAFALITINEIVLSRAIAILEARLKEMEQRLAHISGKQTETAKAIGECIITARGCLRRRAVPGRRRRSHRESPDEC